MKIKLDQLQKIIRHLEKTQLKVIGTKDETGIIISLKEDSQAFLLEEFCKAINDLQSHEVDLYYDDYGLT